MDYTIRSGDTLGGIARRYGTTVQELARLNGISNPDLIRAGTTIRMPDARPAEDYRQPVRPLAPGEQRQNPDGTYSTEITATDQNAGGNWRNFNTLVMTPNGPVQLPPEQAGRAADAYAANTHQAVQTYPTLAEAEAAAVARSRAGGNVNGSLYNPVPPANPARPAAATPPASPPSVPPPSSSGSYTVRSGDTLSRIASQNGTSVEALARLNGISNPNRIGVGQVIQLPPAQGGAPLPPPNIARPGVPGPPMDRGATVPPGPTPGAPPPGWSPVPAAGPVPTTQQWAANRPPTGSIVPGGGDPAYDEVYGGAPPPQPAAAPQPAPPQDMWQGRQGAAYNPTQRSGIQSIGRGGLPDLRSMSMQDFNQLRTTAASVGFPQEMKQALEDETARRIAQLRAELTRIDQSNGMQQNRNAAWQNANERMPRWQGPQIPPSIPGNPANPMPQGQPMPGVPLDPYGPASFQGVEARMAAGQPANQPDPMAALIQALRSGAGGNQQMPINSIIRQLQGAR